MNLQPRQGRPRKLEQLQIQRAIDELRNKELLIDPERDKRLIRKGGNAIPTPYGERLGYLVIDNLNHY
jgi:hypothetical protein